MSSNIKFSNYWNVKTEREKSDATMHVLEARSFIQMFLEYLENNIEALDKEVMSEKLYIVPGWEGRLASLLGQKKSYSNLKSTLSKFLVDK